MPQFCIINIWSPLVPHTHISLPPVLYDTKNVQTAVTPIISRIRLPADGENDGNVAVLLGDPFDAAAGPGPEHNLLAVLWIRIQIGSIFRTFVDPDPYRYSEYGSRRENIG